MVLGHDEQMLRGTMEMHQKFKRDVAVLNYKFDSKDQYYALMAKINFLREVMGLFSHERKPFTYLTYHDE